jgi:hypothetical protein
MNHAQGTADSGQGPKAFSLGVEAKLHSSTKCSFCWFVISIYPTLSGLTDRDSLTYRAHLQREHGLSDEIEP